MENIDFKIRKGKESDLPAVLELIHQEAIENGYPNSVENSVQQMKKEKKNIYFFVAEKNNRIIGIAVYFIAYYTWVGKSLYLDDLFVDSEYRRDGIGTKLLFKVFEIAEKEKCNRLRWEVEEKNFNAQDFYHKLGAKFGDKWFNCDFDKSGIENYIKSKK